MTDKYKPKCPYCGGPHTDGRPFEYAYGTGLLGARYGKDPPLCTKQEHASGTDGAYA